MFIAHFNRLIRNRIVWAVFAFVVVLSFVLAGTTLRGCRRSDQLEDRRGLAGRLFGEDITLAEFNRARFFEMGLRPQASLTPEEEQTLRRRTWLRLAAVRAARRMGLEATAAEVMEALRRDPAFQVNGVFHPQQYRTVLERHLRITPEVFEGYLAETLTLRKLSEALSVAVWNSPLEISRRVQGLTDILTVEYAVVSNTMDITEEDLTESFLKEYFADHKEQFRIPERVRVQYVTFPYSNYLQTVEISEAEIQDYYEDHIEEFSERLDTNSVPVPKPLAEVREEISARLRRRESVNAARDAATEFVVSLVPDRHGKTLSFEAAAESHRLIVCTTDYFTARQALLDPPVGLAFNEAAFALDATDPDRRVSDVVPGERAAYVLAPLDRLPDREPDFEEVRSQVRDQARRTLRQKKFAAHVQELRQRLARAVTRGTGFLEAARAERLAVVTNPPFCIYDGLPTNDAYGDLLLPELLSLKTGEVSRPIAIRDGALLAWVQDRKEGDPATVQLVRPHLLRALDRYRSSILLEEYAEQLLREGPWENYLPDPVGEHEATDEESSPSEQPPRQPPRSQPLDELL